MGAWQTAVKTIAPAQLFDCVLNLRGNVDDAGIIWDLAPTSVLRPTCHITVEQTNATGAVWFGSGSADILYPRGTITPINFPGVDPARTGVDYEDRGIDAIFDPHIVSGVTNRYKPSASPSERATRGAFAAVYDGGVGGDFALIKLGFGQSLGEGGWPPARLGDQGRDRFPSW